MKTHYLKCRPQFFNPSWTGQKGFEVRRNDRDFQEGDLLVLQEWDPQTDPVHFPEWGGDGPGQSAAKIRGYTGREIDARVNYILDATSLSFLGLDLGDYVIMSTTKEATREGVKRIGDNIGTELAPGEPMPQFTPPPPEKLAEGWPPAAATPPSVAPALAAVEDKDGIIAAHKGKLRIADELCKDAAQKVAEAEVQAKDHAKAQAKITALKKELETYQVPDPTVDEIERLDRLIEELDKQISRHQTLLLAVAGYKADLEVSYAAEAELPTLQATVDLYDDLVKALEPGGIPSDMIAEALTGLNDHLAEAGAYLFPDRTLMVTPELNIELEGSPYATLSKSAKFRVGVSFQYALARLAGARILMIDEADILDHVGRAELINFLMTQLYNFDQVLVFFTADQPFYSPVADNWWLENGVIQKVIAR